MIEQIKALGFDPEKLIVVGSGTLSILGLRQARDIDLVGDTSVLSELLHDETWEKRSRDDGSFFLTKDNFEIANNWLVSGPQDDFNSLKSRPDTFQRQGIYFVGLPTLLEWKKRMNRLKDQADIKLIERYLKTIHD